MIDTIVVQDKAAPDFFPYPSVVRWRTVAAQVPWSKWHRIRGFGGALVCEKEIPQTNAILFSPEYDRKGKPTCKKCLGGV